MSLRWHDFGSIHIDNFDILLIVVLQFLHWLLHLWLEQFQEYNIFPFLSSIMQKFEIAKASESSLGKGNAKRVIFSENDCLWHGLIAISSQSFRRGARSKLSTEMMALWVLTRSFVNIALPNYSAARNDTYDWCTKWSLVNAAQIHHCGIILGVTENWSPQIACWPAKRHIFGLPTSSIIYPSKLTSVFMSSK